MGVVQQQMNCYYHYIISYYHYNKKLLMAYLGEHLVFFTCTPYFLLFSY